MKKRIKLRTNPGSGKDVALLLKAVELLGGGEDAMKKMDMLLKGYAAEIHIDYFAGTYKETYDQLNALATAADMMAVALKNLRGAAFNALSIASNTERNERWTKAGGAHLMPQLIELSIKLGKPVEAVGWNNMKGCLSSHYRHEEFTELALFCREESRLFKNEVASGTHTAARLFHQSPTMTLAQACALFIQYFSGDLSRTKELVHIVEELTTGLKPKARWAERECREAKRFAQTLPKIAQSSV